MVYVSQHNDIHIPYIHVCENPNKVAIELYTMYLQISSKVHALIYHSTQNNIPHDAAQ